MSNCKPPIARMGESKIIDDGREDAVVIVNGKRLLTLHQEGYTILGLNYGEARHFVEGLRDLLVALINRNSKENQ